MILALDATYSLDSNPSGVAVYSQQMLRGLPAAHPETRFRFCYRPHRFVRGFRAARPANARAALLWNGWGARRPDLFHALNQRVDAGRYRRVVCTFHDLFVMTGEYSSPEFRARFAEQARQAAQRSDLIVAVSEFTASQVNSLLDVPRSRIRVVPHGVRLPAQVRPVSERERLILFLGAIQKRKNVARLIHAFEAVDPGWRLVLAGSQGYGAEETLAAIESSPRRDDIRVAGYLSPNELADLWQRAAVFAFPSLDEGFGIPVLEAMANGAAVLTSNCSALPEVAGDAALLADPRSVESIEDALRQLTRDEPLRTRLVQRGRIRAEEFSWSRAVTATWEIYRELLGADSP